MCLTKGGIELYAYALPQIVSKVASFDSSTITLVVE